MDYKLKRNISDSTTYIKTKSGKINCHFFGQDKDGTELSLEYLLKEDIKNSFASITLLDRGEETMLSYGFRSTEEILVLSDALRQLHKKLTKAYEIKDELEDKKETL